MQANRRIRNVLLGRIQVDRIFRDDFLSQQALEYILIGMSFETTKLHVL